MYRHDASCFVILQTWWAVLFYGLFISYFDVEVVTICCWLVVAVTECGVNEFRCNDNRQCIPAAFVCNLQRDCLDGSDEERCSTCHIEIMNESSTKLMIILVLLTRTPLFIIILICEHKNISSHQIHVRFNVEHHPVTKSLVGIYTDFAILKSVCQFVVFCA